MLCNTSTLSGLKQQPFVVSRLRVNYVLLISIKPGLDDFPGFACESELTGQLRADWSKLTILSHVVYHHAGDLTLVPMEKECPLQREGMQHLLRFRLAPGTQTQPLHSVARASHKAGLKGGEKALPFTKELQSHIAKCAETGKGEELERFLQSITVCPLATVLFIFFPYVKYTHSLISRKHLFTELSISLH